MKICQSLLGRKDGSKITLVSCPKQHLCKYVQHSVHFLSTGCTNDPILVGDGQCNDVTNNQECHFDGGDCCGYNVTTQYCTECICFEDLECTVPLALIGNSFCNDEANTAVCGYDGGDCCGDCANTNLCSECTCHDGGALPLDISCKSRKVFFEIF